MKHTAKKHPHNKKITAAEFDAKFDAGEDISAFLDTKSATIVQRVNVDFPAWMVQMLDQQSTRLNVSRQALIKMWIHDRLQQVFATPRRAALL